MTLHEELEQRLAAALGAVMPEAEVPATTIAASADLRFGDYQSNAAMVLAKAQRCSIDVQSL